MGQTFASWKVNLESIWIVDSLRRPGERQTGALLHNYLEPLAIKLSPQIRCERRRVVTKDQLLAALREIRSSAPEGVALHLEAHGNDSGLGLASGEHLSWTELADATRPICQASGLNLIVTVIACFGAHFTAQVQALVPAPFLVLFGPNREIHPPAIDEANQAFYFQLLTTRALKPAWEAMNQAVRLTENASFAAVPADQVFKTICAGYVQMHCSPEHVHRRVQDIEAQKRSEGMPRQQVRRLRGRAKALIGDYWPRLEEARRTFFYCSEWPKNDQRFPPLEAMVERPPKLSRAERRR